MPRRLFFIFLFLIFFSTACSLLEGPPQPVLPTPVATAVPFDAGSVNLGELVFDPVSNVVPAVDPAIVALLNEVSQQQLMGYVQTLESFGTRNSFSVTDQQNYGIGAARLWIYNEFIRVGNGRLQVQQQTFPLNYNGLTAEQQNIVATLPGTSGSAGVVVVMAHYDTRPADVADGVSRAPGADDNASGVALLLETARILSSRGWNHTIVFAALAAEEQGTYGARHLLQDLYLKDVPILAAINYDTVGGRSGIPQSIRLFAPDMNVSPSGELGRYYNFISGLYMPTFPISMINALDREGRWGDQREFVNANMRAVRLTESVEDYTLLNSIKDSWDLIDYSYLQQVTQMNTAAVANAIGAPAMPSSPAIAALDSPGSFVLNWTPDPAAAGYVISFRPVDSVDFVPFRFVGANEAGNVAITGLDPNVTYAVSLAALDGNGRVSLFSPEILVAP